MLAKANNKPLLDEVYSDSLKLKLNLRDTDKAQYFVITKSSN